MANGKLPMEEVPVASGMCFESLSVVVRWQPE